MTLSLFPQMHEPLKLFNYSVLSAFADNAIINYDELNNTVAFENLWVLYHNHNLNTIA